MLRALVAALLLANLLFYTWTQGWLDGIVGTRAIGDREPERLARQVRPELVRVVPPDAASAASAAAAASASAAVSGTASASAASAAEPTPEPITLACLEAGPFSDAALSGARNAAREALPGATLTVVQVAKPAMWMIYMGRFPDRDALKKKEEELKRRKLDYEEFVTNPALALGLSLGRYSDRNNATRALDQLAQQGIRTARVIELTPPAVSQMLRIEKADPTIATQATSLKLAALGKGFVPCTAGKPT